MYNIIIEKPVTVIIPSVGSETLEVALESVRKQTYKSVDPIVVYDNVIKRPSLSKDFKSVFLPYPTGADGFYGHRIYAAFSHLVNNDYIFFLDEDNWFDENHVETLVETLEKQQLDFAHSLRKIYSVNGDFICKDNCESLGKYPVFFNDSQFLVDTSSYAFNTQFLRKYGHLWDHGWGADRRFLELIQQVKPKWEGTGLHTLNYKLGGNPGSVTQDFFIEGNKVMNQRYKGVFPWVKS